MTAREGNVLHVPGHTTKAQVGGEEILGSYARFTQKGLTVLSGSGVLEAGTVLIDSGTAKKYKGAAAADMDGTTDPTFRGILRNAVDATATDMLANYVASGVVKTAALKHADGTALSAAEIDRVAAGLNGRVDAIHGYLIF